jgi:hypothetical protein
MGKPEVMPPIGPDKHHYLDLVLGPNLSHRRGTKAWNFRRAVSIEPVPHEE